MRVLVIADRRPTLKGLSLPDYVASKQLDAVITAGDLTRNILKGIESVLVPTMGVYGNHCDGTYLEALGMTNLHMSIATVGGLTFSGLQGCVRYKADPSPLLYTQDEYRTLVQDLPRADVIVTHCPPAGINDHTDPAHTGIQALREWIDCVRPAVLIHGHTYPHRPVTACGATRIEYVNGAKVITV
jgi:uncharacterized protein